VNSSPRFQDAIRPLCERIGVKPPGEHQLSVALAVDQHLTVGLLGYQEGFLVVIAEIAVPVDARDAQRLLPLLAANRFTAATPALIGTVDPDSSRFSLWTRQSLRDLDDPQQLVALFDRMLESASAARDWIQAPLRPAQSPMTSQLLA